MVKQVFLWCKSKHTNKIFWLLTESVFPDPVWAIPTRSLPLSAMGHAWAWIAVGEVHAWLRKSCMTISTKAIRQWKNENKTRS